MTGRLIAVANGRLLGEITRDTRGRLSFTYDAAWRADDTAYPLSLSMPLTASGHGHDRIEPWLWGLLPDNENVLARWARRFQVSPRSVFSLLSATGEDCPGAVQFARRERAGRLLGSGPREVVWLTPANVEARLRTLRSDNSAWRLGRCDSVAQQPSRRRPSHLRQGDRTEPGSGGHRRACQELLAADRSRGEHQAGSPLRPRQRAAQSRPLRAEAQAGDEGGRRGATWVHPDQALGAVCRGRGTAAGRGARNLPVGGRGSPRPSCRCRCDRPLRRGCSPGRGQAATDGDEAGRSLSGRFARVRYGTACESGTACGGLPLEGARPGGERQQSPRARKGRPASVLGA